MSKILLPLLLCLVSCHMSFAQREFWGTSNNGGLYSNGFIFKTDSIGDNLEIVHDFQSAVDGENIGSLTLASNGKLYGMAASGGLNAQGVYGGGTLFEYDLTTDQFHVLQNFGPANTALPNVYIPRGEGRPGLTEISPGVLMGLMRQGSYVFTYNVNTGAIATPFTVPTYVGGAMNSTLQNVVYQAFYKASDNFFYAATQTNSSCPTANPYMGSIMRVNQAGTAVTIRYKAACLVDQGYAYLGFFAEANGKLYGATEQGGVNYQGVIFEYNPAANTYTKRHDFDGSVYTYAPTSLVFAKNGKLYGTAHGGGIPEAAVGLPAGGGVLFEFDLSTNTFIKKHDFTITGQSIYDMGVFPSGLISSLNGKLYGATQYGVFEYNTATDEIRIAGRFNGAGFAPSFLQVCRKPAYVRPASTTYTICEGAAFTLDLASANATTATWKHNTITDASRTTPALTFTSFTAADAGTWICTLTNECGTTVAQTITLQYGQPQPPTITPGGSLTLCAGETVTLTASGGYTGYSWSSGETTAAIIVSEADTYTVTGNNGCESAPSQAVEVIVHELPAQPQPPVASGALTFCTGETVTLTGPAGFTGYKWSNGQTTPSIIASQSGDYTVSVSDGCQSEPSDPVTIVVYPLPPAPTRIDKPAYDKLRAIGTSDVYEWTLNSQVLEGAQTAEIDAGESGRYEVRSVSEHGCLSENFAALDFIVTGVAEDAGASIKIYPNPAQGLFYIEGTNVYGISTITLYDVAGRPVLHKEVELDAEPSMISVGHLSAGLYQVMIKTDNKVLLKKLAIH